MATHENREIAPISVIIPVYNCKPYLEEAIDSILSQPFMVSEIILIDDGSSDGSEKMCDELAEKYLCIHVIHQKNAGVSVARNTGIEYALSRTDSRYLMFLDADDCWNKNWLNGDIIDALQEGHDTVAFDFSYTNFSLTRRGNTYHRFVGVIEGGDQAVAADHQHFAATAYRCDFLRTYPIRFHEGQKWGEDGQFIMEARSLAKTCLFIERMVYLHRDRPTSAVYTRSKATAYYPVLFDGWIKSINFLAEHGFVGTSAIGAINWYMNDMCIEQFREHGKRKDLIKVIANYAEYLQIDDSLTPKEKANKYLERYSRSFEYKQRMIGTVLRIARHLSKLSIVSLIRERRRYPIPLEK